MLSSFPVAVIAGTVLGFLSGLGVGGGSLLILWLTLVLGMDTSTAREINLLFFLPAAGVSCFFRWKQGVLNQKKVLPAVFAGCISTILARNLNDLFHPALLKKLFGCILILTSVRELSYKRSSN